ncbi:MAG: spore germination protein, partial [Firmicutes bacterium]|nr:spore germination protein [Bacillota bacterium]
INRLNMLPLLGYGPWTVCRGSLEAAAAFLGFEVVLLAGSFVNRGESVGKAATVVIGGITLLYSLVVLVTTGVFGIFEVDKFLWPTFEAVKNTQVPGLVLERLDVLFVSVWLVAVFSTLGTYFFFSVQGLARLFGLKEHKVLVLPLLPIMYRLGMEPGSLSAVFRALRWSGLTGIALFVLVPLLLAGISLLRGGGGDFTKERGMERDGQTGGKSPRGGRGERHQ